MTTRKTLMLAALISMAPAGMVMAQSQTMPSDTPPASSPTPSSSATERTESPTTTDNSTATTPSQQHATRTASKQAMKDCVAKQQSDNQGISASDAKKACKQQMKGSG